MINKDGLTVDPRRIGHQNPALFEELGRPDWTAIRTVSPVRLSNKVSGQDGNANRFYVSS